MIAFGRLPDNDIGWSEKRQFAKLQKCQKEEFHSISFIVNYIDPVFIDGTIATR